MVIHRAAGAAVLLLLLSGCEFDRTTLTQPGGRLVVHAVLNPEEQEQIVLVERTLTGRIAVSDSVPFDAADPIVTGGGEPVSGARVVILSQNGDSAVGIERSTLPTQRGKGRGVYAVATPLGVTFDNRLAIVPGAVYRLRVETPDGGRVTGTTRVPAGTRNADSAARFDRSRDTVRLRWLPGAGRTYGIRVDSPYGAFFLFSDSTRFDLAGDLRNFFSPTLPAVFIPGFRQQIIVTVVDSNYFDYYRSRNDPFSGTGILNRLTGGIGLFGAVVTIERRSVEVTQARTRPIEGIFERGGPIPESLDLYVEQEARGVQAISGSAVLRRVVGTGSRSSAGVVGQLFGSQLQLVVLGPSGVIADTSDVFSGTFAGDSIIGRFRDQGSAVFRRRR